MCTWKIGEKIHLLFALINLLTSSFLLSNTSQTVHCLIYRRLFFFFSKKFPYFRQFLFITLANKKYCQMNNMDYIALQSLQENTFLSKKSYFSNFVKFIWFFNEIYCINIFLVIRKYILTQNCSRCYVMYLFLFQSTTWKLILNSRLNSGKLSLF